MNYSNRDQLPTTAPGPTAAERADEEYLDLYRQYGQRHLQIRRLDAEKERLVEQIKRDEKELARLRALALGQTEVSK